MKELKYDLMSRTRVKEACCLQIICLFEKSDASKGADGDDGGKRGKAAAGNRGNDDEKVEFVKLVEPLMQTMKSDN